MKNLSFVQVSLLMAFIMFFAAACEDLPTDIDDFDFPSIDSTDISIDVDFWEYGDTDCDCPLDFEPVCAEGITFPNACIAECAGFTDFTNGECEYDWSFPIDTLDCPWIDGSTDCECDFEIAPVCADGFTFPNACVAECAGYTTYEDGVCDNDWIFPIDTTDIDFPWGGNGGTDCDCAEDYAPVCVDGLTLPNACIAECLGFTTYQDGECDNDWGFPIDTTDIDFPWGGNGGTDCDCAEDYAPVCVDGLTLPNACIAECLGFTTYEDGECDNNDWGFPIDTIDINFPWGNGGNNGGGFDCNCTLDYTPVCAGGFTFPNACIAECAGFTTYEAGECP